jgi:hypothetical protein
MLKSEKKKVEPTENESNEDDMLIIGVSGQNARELSGYVVQNDLGSNYL